MSQGGVNTAYTYKVTGPDGTDRYIGGFVVGEPLLVSNYSTTVAIGAFEAVSLDTTNTNIPIAPGSTSQVLEQKMFGLCTVSGAKNFLGVALTDCPVKDTTKPDGTYTIPVAGVGSLMPVRTKASLTSSTIGNVVEADTTTGFTDAKTSATGLATVLGQLVKAQATITNWKGARDASATTAYFVGVYVNPR